VARATTPNYQELSDGRTAQGSQPTKETKCNP
jgi:hypothetical protein